MGLFKCKQARNLRFLKQLLGLRSQAQNYFIYGETRRCPLRVERLIQMLKYWFKVIQSSERKYIKQTYNMMLNDLIEFPNKQN